MHRRCQFISWSLSYVMGIGSTMCRALNISYLSAALNENMDADDCQISGGKFM